MSLAGFGEMTVFIDIEPAINGYAMPLNASQNCTNDQRDEINMNKEAVFVKID